VAELVLVESKETGRRTFVHGGRIVFKDKITQ
jgi:hypothetical protein